MLESRQRAGLQLISMLARHYLNMARVEGSDARTKEEAAALLGVNAFPAGKALQQGRQLGAERLSTAVRWLTEADLALKGGVSYGGKDLESDLDVTELTVIEVLVARLARLSFSARRR
jgi:DNA polymerase III delta subunit